ncbi:MAG: BlaI/MecI/CopY family transcriptional regulator [Myxococcales bacterium]|nr:BlaI/MecI/CopY family transcriptional regulator [Myxococcales bacterium]
MPDDLQLSDLQLAIMRALWECGEAGASEIQGILADGGRDLAQTTVSTLLSRLSKRGLVKARRRGRGFVYSSAIAEHEIRESMVSRVTDHLFDGDVTALVSHLLRRSDVSRDDLAEVRRLIAAAEQAKESDHE